MTGESVSKEPSRVPDPLAESAARFPNAIALISDDGRLTYRQLDAAAGRCAACLRDMGIGAGRRLAIALPNSVEYVILMLGLIRLGAVACPLSIRLPDAALKAAVEELGALALVVAGAQAPEGVRSLNGARLMGDESRTLRDPAAVDPEQWATIVYTSGTSGSPKPAVHALRGHCANAEASNRNLPLGPGDRWLLSLPLYHVSGIAVVFRCLAAGAAIVVPRSATPLEEALATHSVTHVSLVAAQLLRLLGREAPSVRAGALKAVLLGGGPVPPALTLQSFEQQIPVYLTYGLTETSSQVATSRPPDFSRSLDPTAYPILEGTVRISPEGEIQVRGDTLFKGYLRDGELELPLTEDGWFPTGDLGTLDENGGLTVLGRNDAMFVSGGENIVPEEIEAHLCACEGIAQAVVVPVDDSEFGARPVAFIRLSGGMLVEGNAIESELGRKLPNFKIPKTIHLWPKDLEIQGVKVDRSAFKTRAEELDR